jgi:Raf kinase inhibitor-like YbhB/YbcL family protein
MEAAAYPRRVARARSATATVLALLACAGCGDESVEGPSPKAPDTLHLASPAFAAGAAIPARFTCDGDDEPPPLEWTGVPSGTRSIALLMEDPDAPDGTFVHWTVYGIRADAGRVPPAAVEGESSFGDTGYGGPCPPEGDDPHRYVFYLYALRSPLGLEAGAAPDAVRDAIAERAIARGRLTARYGR